MLHFHEHRCQPPRFPFPSGPASNDQCEDGNNTLSLLVPCGGDCFLFLFARTPHFLVDLEAASRCMRCELLPPFCLPRASQAPPPFLSFSVMLNSRLLRRVAPVHLSGRCFLCRTSSRPSGGKAEGRYVDLTTELSPSFASASTYGGSAAATSSRENRAKPSGAHPVPLSLAGNSYYERRFAPHGKGSAAGNGGGHRHRHGSTSDGSEEVPSFQVGDVVVRLLHTTTSHAVRHAAAADVAGTRARAGYVSFDPRPGGLTTVESVVQDMHLYDGSEVAVLERGEVNTGKLSVSCVIACGGGASSGHDDTMKGVLRHRIVAVDNAAVALMGSRHLRFRSTEQGLQMARVLAERCAAGAVDVGFVLKPVVRDGHTVAVRCVRTDQGGMILN